jgi:hypothetical protein
MPDAVPVTVDQLASLAVEHWRLARAIDAAPAASTPAARHALRKIGDLLKNWQVEARPLDGVAYDPGLSATVIDRVDDPALPAGTEVIVETLAPLVLAGGRVVRPAEVIVGRNPAPTR